MLTLEDLGKDIYSCHLNIDATTLFSVIGNGFAGVLNPMSLKLILNNSKFAMPISEGRKDSAKPTPLMTNIFFLAQIF